MRVRAVSLCMSSRKMQKYTHTYIYVYTCTYIIMIRTFYISVLSIHCEENKHGHCNHEVKDYELVSRGESDVEGLTAYGVEPQGGQAS